MTAETGTMRDALQSAAFQRLSHLLGGDLQPLLLHQVGLRQGDDAPGDLDEVQDGQVLPGLGHDRLVGSHDEEGEVDAAHSGQHVLDEPLVAGHVHDADLPPAGQRQPREAQVDGHLPPLLLLEPVGVDARQGAHKAGLTVINVSGGSDDVHPLAWRGIADKHTRGRASPAPSACGVGSTAEVWAR